MKYSGLGHLKLVERYHFKSHAILTCLFTLIHSDDLHSHEILFFLLKKFNKIYDFTEHHHYSPTPYQLNGSLGWPHAAHASTKKVAVKKYHKQTKIINLAFQSSLFASNTLNFKESSRLVSTHHATKLSLGVVSVRTSLNPSFIFSANFNHFEGLLYPSVLLLTSHFYLTPLL